MLLVTVISTMVKASSVAGGKDSRMELRGHFCLQKSSACWYRTNASSA